MSTLVRGSSKAVLVIAGGVVVVAASLVRFLSRGDPDMARLMAAPKDDEPFTDEQQERVKAALERARAGQSVREEDAFPDAEAES
jgi:hypothetical protein